MILRLFRVLIIYSLKLNKFHKFYLENQQYRKLSKFRKSDFLFELIHNAS